MNVLQTALSFCPLMALQSGDPDDPTISAVEYIMIGLVSIFFIQLFVQLYWNWYVRKRRSAMAREEEKQEAADLAVLSVPLTNNDDEADALSHIRKENRKPTKSSNTDADEVVGEPMSNPLSQ